jgi:hypothetical protein
MLKADDALLAIHLRRDHRLLVFQDLVEIRNVERERRQVAREPKRFEGSGRKRRLSSPVSLEDRAKEGRSFGGSHQAGGEEEMPLDPGGAGFGEIPASCGETRISMEVLGERASHLLPDDQSTEHGLPLVRGDEAFGPPSRGPPARSVGGAGIRAASGPKRPEEAQVFEDLGSRLPEEAFSSTHIEPYRTQMGKPRE